MEWLDQIDFEFTTKADLSPWDDSGSLENQTFGLFSSGKRLNKKNLCCKS